MIGRTSSVGRARPGGDEPTTSQQDTPPRPTAFSRRARDLGRDIATRARRAELTDGTRVFVRAIRPSDKIALRAFFHALSPETRYQRFLGHLADLTPSMVRHFTEVDGDDHVAYVALHDGADGEPTIVGVVRLIRQPDVTRAEIAVTVRDDMQRRGLGTVLLETIVARARSLRVRVLVAHVLPGNVGIRRLLSKFGQLSSASDGAIEVILRDPAWLPHVVVSRAGEVFAVPIRSLSAWIASFGGR